MSRRKEDCGQPLPAQEIVGKKNNTSTKYSNSTKETPSGKNLKCSIPMGKIEPIRPHLISAIFRNDRLTSPTPPLPP